MNNTLSSSELDPELAAILRLGRRLHLGSLRLRRLRLGRLRLGRLRLGRLSSLIIYVQCTDWPKLA